MADDEAVAAGDQSTEGSGGSRKKLILIAAGLLAVIGGGAAFLFLSEPEPTPSEKLQSVLDLIDRRASAWEMRRSEAILDELDASGFVDPSFSAGVRWTRGMIVFREGQEFQGQEQQKRYLNAIEHFDYAWLRAMPEERKSELAYSLGVALQTVGLSTRAREVLEIAYEIWPQKRAEISLLLVENYVAHSDDSYLAAALKYCDELDNGGDLSAEDRKRAALLRVDVLSGLGRVDEAEAALADVASTGSGEQETFILRAQSLMREADARTAKGDKVAAESKYMEAQKLLEASNGSAMPGGAAAKTLYLKGLCSERLEMSDSAVDYYRQVVRRFPASDDSFAAELRMAGLLQEAGRNEEALRAYRQILRQITRPSDFRSRWLTLDQLRNAIRLGWSSWLEDADFADALELAKSMSPLIDRVDALRFAARTTEAWASAVDLKWRQAKVSDKPALLEESRSLWSNSGDAWGELARNQRTEARYPEIVRASAEHYSWGYEFDRAVEQIDEFIRSAPTKGIPAAHVFRGRMYMNLDRLDDAFGEFEFVIENAPTDPSVFEARLLLGRCQLEMRRPNDAERSLRQILGSDQLAPSANEWRLAKFSLARLLIHQASDEFRSSEPEEGIEPTADQMKLRIIAFSRWREAIQHLDEYLRRYPSSENRIEARYLLARSFQRAAIEPRHKLKEAMPANARKELYREITQHLEGAVREYRTLQQELQEYRSQGQLDAFGQELYRTSFFEIPHSQFSQALYSDALTGYRTATSRFPEHINVLTAYVQMARCYEHLDQPDEARRQLEQARVILKRFPDEAFDSPSSGLSREEWSAWIDWARRVHEEGLTRAG